MTGSWDESARIWDARTGELTVELSDSFSLRQADGDLHWPVPPIELVRIGCERLQVVGGDEARAVEGICAPVLERREGG